MTFDFKTLKDNTFCIYDVKEGQADKIKVIMGELGIGDYHNWDKETYYVADNDIGEIQANRRIIFDMNRKNTKETYRKTATEFLEEYGEWNKLTDKLVDELNDKPKFKVGDKVKWLETGFVGTIKRHCKTFGDSWYINNEYNSCSENNLELVEEKELHYKQSAELKDNIHEEEKETFLERIENLEPIIKPNIIKKTMNTIKKVLRSKEDKALAHFVLGTSKELRSSGKEEFLDFIYETGKTDKVEFLKKIVEAYEEDKK